MTIAEAIGTVDRMYPNVYDQGAKVRWLSELDGSIKLEIIDTHEGGEDIEFEGYDSADGNTPLLVGAPWDDLYIKWLELKIDYANRELTRYNNSVAAFHAAYSAFAKWYNRTHAPLGSGSFKY